MVDFKPDREQEVKEFNSVYKSRDVRAIYAAWPQWLKTALKIVAVLIILILLVLIGRAIHHSLKDNNSAKTPSGQTTHPQVGTPLPKAPSANGGSNSGSTNSSGAVKPTEVPNTGPGDVAAVFALSSAAGASLHYTLKRRRA